MPSNLVSATLTAADLTAVQAALQTLRDKLPFLVDLNRGGAAHVAEDG